MLKNSPLISVVVPTKNSLRMIEKCLNSLFNQTFSNYEVILVDGHSTDGTLRIASKFPVRIFFENGGTRASACNMGILRSRGEIVAFTDDDCIVPENWIERIVKHFDKPDVCVVGGPGLTPKDSGKWEKTFGAIRTLMLKSTTRFGSVELIPGCNSAYKKSIVNELGGFTEYLPTAEETELHFRIMKSGGKLVYDQSLAVYHYPRVNLLKFLRQHFRYGIGKGLFLKLHPSFLKVSDVIAFASIFVPLSLLPILLLSVCLGVALIEVLILTFLVATFSLSLYASMLEQEIYLFPLVFVTLIFYIFVQGLGHTAGLLKINRRKKVLMNSTKKIVAC